MSIKIIIEDNGSVLKYKKFHEIDFRVLPKVFSVRKHIHETEGSIEHFTVNVINLHTSEYLFDRVKIDEIEVGGIVYATYEELSTVLTPILYSDGSSTPEPDYTTVLEEIRDGGYDTEYITACDSSDSQNKEPILVKIVTKKVDGSEDLTKRRYIKNGVELTTPPSMITWGICGEDALKEFTFSVDPNGLPDQLEQEFEVVLSGVLLSDRYDLIYNIPTNRGIEIVNHSWEDDKVIVTIFNNKGIPLTNSIDFILKEV